MVEGLFTAERKKLFQQLLSKKVLAFSKFNKFEETVIASNADKGQRLSVQLSNLLLKKIGETAGLEPELLIEKQKGQTSGNDFETLCAEYLQSTFLSLKHLRPGDWLVEKVGGRSSGILGRYEQYAHLAELSELIKDYAQLKSVLGDGYTIAPDIVVARLPESDEAINSGKAIVDSVTCKASKLRKANHSNPDNPEQLIHASISCKFTMRSDRAQNSRTEALNLLRSRKGRAPHIVALTAEAVPSRIASLAMGTGDIDCVYHIALYELLEATEALGKDDALASLQDMILGKRLKDISDLPLDLAI